MAHRTGITLRLTPEDRANLETLQAFTQERAATRAVHRLIHHATIIKLKGGSYQQKQQNSQTMK